MSVKVIHYESGQIKSITIRNEKGQLHNLNGPAYQDWYKNGQEQYRECLVKGRRHNPEGPAVQRWYETGQEAYRAYQVNKKYHNPEGPALQEWCRNGQEICRDYWIDGKELTEEEFNQYRNTIEVTCNGKLVRISKESAKALNLI